MIWFIVQALGQNAFVSAIQIVVDITIRSELTAYFSTTTRLILHLLKGTMKERRRSLSWGKHRPRLSSHLVCAWCRSHGFGHILLEQQHQQNPEELVSSHRGDQLRQDGQAPVLRHVGQGIHKHADDLYHHFLHASRWLRQITVLSLRTKTDSSSNRRSQTGTRYSL